MCTWEVCTQNGEVCGRAGGGRGKGDGGEGEEGGGGGVVYIKEESVGMGGM